ncbi:hypothetical protein ACLI4Z_06745 [Natrialbaceae archaeon A-arb3/5]
MVFSYVLIALLAIAACATFVSAADGAGTAVDAVEQLVRAVVVLAVLLLALPLGAFLGAFTVSTMAESLLVGLVVLGGSTAVVALLGLGLFIVAEGTIPESLRRAIGPRNETLS